MQPFVFLDSKFAGTISPVAMSSRTDGAQRQAQIIGEDMVTAEFARYGDKDPLCCPSRYATVLYVLKTTPEGPLLVPVQLGHQDAPRQGP
jgi:hypothetical protein